MKTTVVLIFAALYLSACADCNKGSAGCETAATIPFGGIYLGSVVPNDPSTSLFGIVDENGNARFLHSDSSGFTLIAPSGELASDNGLFSSDDTVFKLNGQAFNSAGQAQAGSIAGTVVARTDITATFTAAGSKDLTEILIYVPSAYEMPSSLATVAGSYSFSYSSGTQTYTGTITLSDAGVLGGTDTAGCSYSGMVTVPNASYNAYDITMTNSCGSGGELKGVAAYFPGGAPKGALLVAVNNASTGGVVTLNRSS